MSEAITELKKRGQPIRNVNITDITMNYKQPPSAIVSILHRISGFVLFLALPFLLYLLKESLLSETSYAHFAGILSNPLIKLIVLVLAAGYIHHFIAGIRHLFMDNHFALDKDASQRTARWVLIADVVVILLVALKLFGVF
jgi:succinate dehydrogenase / fumarate reductase, cytochrome b subunit